MRISYNWLTSWVATDLDAEQVAERFTTSGLEVDSLTELGAGLERLVVAEITAVAAHPDADRLTVCTVDYGTGATCTVVCGAPNARPGLKVPLAVPGTTLPGGLEIRAAELRGVASEGMLCSEPELGLGDDAEGLMELPGEASPGTPLMELLGLPDWIVEFDLTPNRADCLSLRGLARELAAFTGIPVTPPDMPPLPAAGERRIPIELVSPADCSRYAGRIIEGIDATARTPQWMVDRLRASGLRSLGPTVDVTNYVLLELGQPMHAFDLDCVNGGIRVRRPETGDRIVLLDGREIEPDQDMLLIADHQKPVALAGVMGGADSAVTEKTSNILLESAWFNPASIVGRARRLGLSTESAHRFERGVDPALQVAALERASALIVEIAGGRPGPVIDVTAPEHRPDNPPVTLRLKRVNHLLGSVLTGSEVRDVLDRLGMQVDGGDEQLTVTAPPARRDIEIEADLIEEIARVTGYDRLPANPPGGRLQNTVASETRVPRAGLFGGLQARGLQEVMTWSFVPEAELQRLGLADGAQPLANPLNRDMAVLRTSLLPGLLKTAAANMRRQQHRLRLFEAGHVFANTESGFAERDKLGILLYGAAHPEGWADPDRALDFYDLKGEIEQLVAVAGHHGAVEFKALEAAWLHPGQAAAIELDGRAAGWLGQLHPALAADMDFRSPVLVAELDLERLCRRALPVHREVARFPAVRRDLALVVPDGVAAADLLATIRAAGGELLEDQVIFDQYRGKGVETGYKSIAIGLIFREVSRTLTDEEVENAKARIVSELTTRHNANLRG